MTETSQFVDVSDAPGLFPLRIRGRLIAHLYDDFVVAVTQDASIPYATVSAWKLKDASIGVHVGNYESAEDFCLLGFKPDGSKSLFEQVEQHLIKELNVAKKHLSRWQEKR